MVKFEKLGYSTFDEYFKDFMKTLLPTNKTYEYFVDWKRVSRMTSGYKNQLKILNSLYGLNKEDAMNRLEKILQRHPSVLPVLPKLIAERPKKGELTVVDEYGYLTLNFKEHIPTSQEIQNILKFCELTGILDVLTKIENIEEYLFGVEVGLDTHGRKGRSGKLFDNMIQKTLISKVPDQIQIIPQDKKLSNILGNNKKPDFVLYKDKVPLVMIEANFYNTQGSKPEEIVRSYIHLHEISKEKGIVFVWVTDGPGWRSMANDLKIGMKKIDWVVNYSQLPKLLAYFNSINWELEGL